MIVIKAYLLFAPKHISMQGMYTFYLLHAFFQLDRHSECIELCMDHALGSCEESHEKASEKFEVLYQVNEDVTAALTTLPESTKDAHGKKWGQLLQLHWDYVSHLIRTKHQGDYYR